LIALDPAYFAKLAASLDETCAQHFYHLLMRRDLSGWNPKAFPSTRWRANLQAASQPPAAAFLQDIIDEGWFEEGKILAQPLPTEVWACFREWSSSHGQESVLRAPMNYTERKLSLDLAHHCGVHSFPTYVKRIKKTARASFYDLQATGKPGGDYLSPEQIRVIMIRKLAWVNREPAMEIEAAPALINLPRLPRGFGKQVDAPTNGRPQGEKLHAPTSFQIDPQRGSMCAVHALRNAAQDFPLDSQPTFTDELLQQGAKRAATKLNESVALHMRMPFGDNFSIEAIMAAVDLAPGYHCLPLANYILGLGDRGEPTTNVPSLESCAYAAFGDLAGEKPVGLLMQVPGHYVAWRLIDTEHTATPMRHPALIDSTDHAHVEVFTPTAFGRLLRERTRRVVNGTIGTFPRFYTVQLFRSHSSASSSDVAYSAGVSGSFVEEQSGYWDSGSQVVVCDDVAGIST
jgi:hypothetical protein